MESQSSDRPELLHTESERVCAQPTSLRNEEKPNKKKEKLWRIYSDTLYVRLCMTEFFILLTRKQASTCPRVSKKLVQKDHKPCACKCYFKKGNVGSVRKAITVA